MAYGANTKVCSFTSSLLLHETNNYKIIPLVDYILFLTADVTVNGNPNEIRDHKYVDKAELQAMFNAPGPSLPLSPFATDLPSLLTHDTGNLFTPWFKLIARDFLFGWWDTLLERRTADGKVDAKSLAGVVDGAKVIKMI